MIRPWLLVSSVCAITQLATPALAKRAEEPARPHAAVKAPPKAAPAKPVAPAKTPAKSAPPAANTRQAKPKGPCLSKPVQLARSRGPDIEPDQLSLTLCNGKPNVAVLDALSLLARPRDVTRPSASALRAYRQRPALPTKGKVSAKNRPKYRDPLFVTERVMRLHPGLLVRLQRIANRYPGKIIEIVSGYRPDSRDTSRHHHGRALDLRVAGLQRESLRDFLRSLDETGVGYYPNSYFVHMDVRDIKGYWVDRSGPGETPDYGPWPDAIASRTAPSREDILQGAFAELSNLGKPPATSARSRAEEPRAPAPRDKHAPLVTRVSQPAQQASANKAKVREPEQEADDMSAAEVARVRAEARKALEGL